MKKRIRGCLLLAACLGATSPAYSNSAGFVFNNGSYTPLSVPGSQQTEAFGINNAGQVVGDYWNDNVNAGFHDGFLYSQGLFTTIQVSGFQQTVPFGINSSSEIVGYVNNNFGAVSQGFIYMAGSITILNVPGSTGTWAYGVNDAGQVVGTYADATGTHGFIYTSGNYSTFSVPGWTNTNAQGINDSGQVVGGAASGGFLLNKGQFFPINGVAEDINNLGQIVGENTSGAFLYENGSYTIFNAPNSPPTQIEFFGINDSEQIVGRYNTDFPVPGPIVGAGVPGLLAGFGVMLAWRRKRPIRRRDS